MKTLAKYLKGKVPVILAIVTLLILQAFCDLSLPSYTSRIITQGIQGKGIDSPIPPRIRMQSLEDLTLFLSEEEASFVKSCYEPEAEAEGETGGEKAEKEEEKREDGKSKKEEQEKEAKNNAFQLKDLSGTDREHLEAILPLPEMLLVFLSSGADLQSLGFSGEGDPMPQNLLPVLRLMPSEMRMQQLSKFTSALSAIPSSTMESSAILFVSQELEALGENLERIQNRYLVHVGLRMMGLSLLVMVCTILVSFLAVRLAAGFSRDIRGDVYRKVMRFNDEEFHRYSTASLITRSTNDIQQVQFLLSIGLRLLLYAPIIGVGGVIKVARTNASLSWIIALALLCIFALLIVLFKVAMPRFVSLQSLIDRMNLVTREQLTGVMVTRAFTAEKREEERFDKANQDLTKTNLFVNRCMTFMMPLMMLIMNGVSVLLIYHGAISIDRGAMQVGDLMAFIQYSMQIIMSFLMISALSIMLPRARVAAGRIAEILRAPIAMQETDSPIKPSADRKGELCFDHVSFAYPGAEENILTDISFTVGKGQTLAIIGSTGSGKTTLSGLIPRLYDVTGGKILFDGVDIREMELSDLRSRIGYVAQKSVLFSGTIASNISFGKKDADIAEAARLAQAEDFILEKELTYDSPISQGGTNVSGGQKQRLSIARALARKPELLIFDDSFSALDFKTDSALRLALRENRGDTTILIVAQRISTIMGSDQILVLEEGKAVGLGTHEELMESCEVYRQIAISQLSSE